MDKKDNSDSLSDNSTELQQPSKRRVVRHVLTGGGVIGASAMSGNWQKPTLDSVLLPAHARSSGTSAPTSAPTICITCPPTVE